MSSCRRTLDSTTATLEPLLALLPIVQAAIAAAHDHATASVAATANTTTTTATTATSMLHHLVTHLQPLLGLCSSRQQRHAWTAVLQRATAVLQAVSDNALTRHLLQSHRSEAALCGCGRTTGGVLRLSARPPQWSPLISGRAAMLAELPLPSEAASVHALECFSMPQHSHQGEATVHIAGLQDGPGSRLTLLVWRTMHASHPSHRDGGAALLHAVVVNRAGVVRGQARLAIVQSSWPSADATADATADAKGELATRAVITWGDGWAVVDPLEGRVLYQQGSAQGDVVAWWGMATSYAPSCSGRGSLPGPAVIMHCVDEGATDVSGDGAGLRDSLLLVHLDALRLAASSTPTVTATVTPPTPTVLDELTVPGSVACVVMSASSGSVVVITTSGAVSSWQPMAGSGRAGKVWVDIGRLPSSVGEAQWVEVVPASDGQRADWAAIVIGCACPMPAARAALDGSDNPVCLQSLVVMAWRTQQQQPQQGPPNARQATFTFVRHGTAHSVGCTLAWSPDLAAALPASARHAHGTIAVVVGSEDGDTGKHLGGDALLFLDVTGAVTTLLDQSRAGASTGETRPQPVPCIATAPLAPGAEGVVLQSVVKGLPGAGGHSWAGGLVLAQRHADSRDGYALNMTVVDAPALLHCARASSAAGAGSQALVAPMRMAAAPAHLTMYSLVGAWRRCHAVDHG